MGRKNVPTSSEVSSLMLSPSVLSSPSQSTAPCEVMLSVLDLREAAIPSGGDSVRSREYMGSSLLFRGNSSALSSTSLSVGVGEGRDPRVVSERRTVTILIVVFEIGVFSFSLREPT